MILAKLACNSAEADVLDLFLNESIKLVQPLLLKTFIVKGNLKHELLFQSLAKSRHCLYTLH